MNDEHGVRHHHKKPAEVEVTAHRMCQQLPEQLAGYSRYIEDFG